MNTSKWICERFGLDPAGRSPIEIPNFGRADLAGLFAELGYRFGVELGVERGLFTEVLAKANPEAEIVGVDAWAAYRGYRDHVSQEKLDGFYQETQERLAKYPNAKLLRMFSDEAVRQFTDESLDFVYIDGNHEWAHITHDIYAWAKKVRHGGIVSGHDYRESKRLDTRNHVVPVVDAYMRAYKIKPWFLLGAKAKTPGVTRDDARSWMFVK